MPKIKKQTKKRKKKNKSQIKQTNIINIGYGTQSEKIVHNIIEKIISLVITKSQINLINSNNSLTNRLMTYTKNIINPLVQITFMSYDYDNLFINNNNLFNNNKNINNNNKNIKNNNKNINNNNKNLLNNNNKNLLNNNNKYLLNNNNNLLNNNNNNNLLININNLEWEDPIEPESPEFDRNESKFILINKNKFYDSLINEENIINKKIKRKSNEISTKSLINLNNNNNNIKKAKKEKIIFESFEIKNLNEKNDSKEIEFLRKNYIKFLNEKKEKEKIENEKKKENFLPKNKKNQIFDSLKFTINDEGKIIKIKKFQNFPKIFKIFPSNNKLIKYNEKDNNIINKKFYKEKNFIIEDENKQTNKNIYNRTLKKIEYKNKNIIQPSGDNFHLFEPNFGVNLKMKRNNKNEPKREKKGKKNFYEKYKRFSIQQFNQILDETFKLNEINRENTIKSSDSSYSNNSFNNNENNNKNNNNNENNNKNNENNEINNKNNEINNNENLFGSLNSLIINNKNSILSNSSSIFLKSKSSINLLLDAFDFQNNNNSSYIKNSNSNKTILNESVFSKDYFKIKYLNERKKLLNENDKFFKKSNNSFDVINKFNYNLVKNKNLEEKEIKGFYYLNNNNNINEFPSLKLPMKPNYNKLIKINGIWQKIKFPMRINHEKNNK